MSKLKNITIRIPVDSGLYETLKSKVEGEGSWSGATLKMLRDQDNANYHIAKCARQAKHLAQAHQEIESLKQELKQSKEHSVRLRNINSEKNAEFDKIYAGISELSLKVNRAELDNQDLKVKLEEAELDNQDLRTKLESSDKMSESWRKLCVALMSFLGGIK